MFKFLYVILRNLFRAPYMIPRMRYEADHPKNLRKRSVTGWYAMRLRS